MLVFQTEINTILPYNDNIGPPESAFQKQPHDLSAALIVNNHAPPYSLECLESFVQATHLFHSNLI